MKLIDVGDIIFYELPHQFVSIPSAQATILDDLLEFLVPEAVTRSQSISSAIPDKKRS